jgi:hypothetical protein
LATTPGPGGAIYPNINDIPSNAGGWADFGGNLGKLKNPDGSDVTGATLKQWMRAGTVFNVHKDATDPAHPNLVVDGEVPTPPPTDTTSVKVTSGGHGPTANPDDGAQLLVTFMFMAGPTEPTPEPTPGAAAIGEYLGVPVDERMELCAQAARVWVENRRCNTPPEQLWQSADVVLGGILYGALLYQSRATPLGISGYEEANLYNPASPDALYRARDLVGLDPVTA